MNENLNLNKRSFWKEENECRGKFLVKNKGALDKSRIFSCGRGWFVQSRESILKN